MTRGSTAASVAAARWLVAVMVSVVLSFAVTALVTHYYENAVVDRAEDIVGSVMPGVDLVSTARGDLRTLENRLEELGAGQQPPEDVHADIARLRASLDDAVRSYPSRRPFTSEPMRYFRVIEDRARLTGRLDSFVGDPSAARLAAVRGDIDALDTSLQRVESADAAYGQRLGREIAVIHQRASSIGIVLDAVTALLAVVATLLALRQLARAAHARVVEEAEQRRREHELCDQNEALAQFAGRVAHDILSPLNAAQLCLDIVRETSTLRPPADRAVDRGVAAIRRVHHLVGGLLAFSRAGGRPQAGDATEVAPLVLDVIAELRPEAIERQIELGVSPIPDGSVACSNGVLTSVLSNLIRNAIKYMGDTPERRIEVRADHRADHWRFEVEDTGPGIALEHRRHVFEPYVQLAPGSSGIGLGLATVDRLVRAHGGVIGLTSGAHDGALFWVELPEVRPQAQPA